MTERRTDIPQPGDAREAWKGTTMSEFITAEEITVRPAAQSFHDYIAARVDIDSLSSAEVVEMTFALHSEWQSSPERKAEREAAKAEREAEAEVKRAAREEAKRERLAAEKAALEAKLAKLSK